MNAATEFFQKKKITLSCVPLCDETSSYREGALTMPALSGDEKLKNSLLNSMNKEGRQLEAMGKRQENGRKTKIHRRENARQGLIDA